MQDRAGDGSGHATNNNATTTTPLSSRPVSRDQLSVSQESYTEHWRRISQQSLDIRPATLPPSRSSFQGITSPSASPTADRPGYHIVNTPYKPEDKIVYKTYPETNSSNSNTAARPSRLHLTRSVSAPDLRTDVSIGARLKHKPTPRRVYVYDPRTEPYRVNYAARKRPVKPEPGCCGLCEVSSAAAVGAWVGGWLTGVFKVVLTGMAAGCAAKMCSGG